ncbi:MAG: cell division protein ZapB [Deltaproteobacteria bacterium]|nr:cell division protein ZapB [Deltaproteobacteria bacterium]
MESDKFGILEERVHRLIESHGVLIKENARLKGDLKSLEGEKEQVKEKVEALIRKLDGLINEA